jgi:nucleotide-binding universal stress UspA family protein
MDATGSANGAGFGRMLVVLDGSADADAAAGFAEAAAGGFGTIASYVELREQTARRRCEQVRGTVRNGRHATNSTVSGPTEGTRNRLVAHRIAEEAKECGADVIVLGVDHRRLAHHRLSSSLRSRLAEATDLPVLVAPAAPSEATAAPTTRDAAGRPGAERHGADVGRLTRV